MGLSLLIITICLTVGGVSAVLSLRPGLLPELAAGLKQIDPVRKFSPRRTLFLIGPSANHPACKLQRRLLKPAIPSLIREDVTVMEVYGEDHPRRNGEQIDWLDSSLLRHAMDAQQGFYVVYVDEAGKTVFRSEAPIITADLLKHARLDIQSPASSKPKSSVIEKLRAA